MKRSSSKENIQTNIARSYNEFTSPLTSLKSIKQKTHLKNSLKNNVMLKMQMYENNQIRTLNKTMNIHQVKAASFIYKIPEFSSSDINFQVPQAIKMKVEQIKNDMVTHLPQIKSSNYNPRKLQNQFNHRSSILQLQEWLKNRLRENPPQNIQESIQYKNMIMGIGMKQLIRMINKRCIQEGKMVEQVWELTWSICRQIIVYLSKRAKKCEDVLQTQLNFYNANCKQNFSNVQSELKQAKQKMKILEEENSQLKKQLEQIQIQNQKLMIQNSTARVNQGNYHEEFLKILQENLAIYLQIGDNKKRDWIKKMYIQVSKAKNQIKNSMKKQINTAIRNRIRDQNVIQDQVDEGFQINEFGDYAIANAQNAQQVSKDIFNQDQCQGQNHTFQQKHKAVAQQCQKMKQKLQEAFKPIDQETQTQNIYCQEAETYYQSLTQTLEAEVQTDKIQCFQMGSNTQQNVNLQVNAKIGQTKAKKQKQSIMVTQKKQKMQKITNKQRRGQRKSSIVQNKISVQEKTIVNAPLSRFITNNSLEQNKIITLTDEGEQSSKVQMIQYVCRQCKGKKSCFQVQLQKSDQQLNTKQKMQNIQNRLHHNVGQNVVQKGERWTQRRSYQQNYYQLKKGDIIQELDQQNQYYGNDPNRYPSKQKRSKQQLYDNKQQFYQNQQQNSNKSKQKSNSNSFHSSKGGDKTYGRAHKKRRDSTMIHDVTYKKEMQVKQRINFKQNQNFEVLNDQDNFLKVNAKLSIAEKQPYFKFFHDQIIQTNKFYLQETAFPQINSDYILDKYFFLVQQINDLPESKIILNQKQMNAAIEKNLIPIIVQLLGQVKKSVKNNSIQQTIRNFPSLPYTIMNKFSTKYGVKILAIKNMKILLSSLKKIETYSQKYKLLRLMLFTDCKAYYSEDLFVYLLIISIMDPFIQIDKTINYEQINKLRSICQTYLTKDKSVYEQFNRLTKEQLGKTKTQSTFSQIKLAPLVRSVITSYRMMKINKIQELGFIFFMLRNDNHVDYNVFSFFISCLQMDTSVKVKIVKTFLANCDIKLKNNKIAISESGYSKFLIRCSQFSFDYLRQIVAQQKENLSSVHKSRSISDQFQSSNLFNKKVGQRQNQNQRIKNLNHKHPRVSLPNIENEISGLIHQDTRLSTQKQILLTSRKSLLKPLESIQTSNQQLQEFPKVQRLNNKKLSLLYRQRNKSDIPRKFRQYSSFTFQIVRFLQNKQDSKLITSEQKSFLQDYLHIHVLNSQLEELIGIVDYFSNEMLQIVCMQKKQLQINEKGDKNKQLLLMDELFH